MIQAVLLTLVALAVIGVGAVIAMSLREPKRIFEPMSKQFTSPMAASEIRRLEDQTSAKMEEIQQIAQDSGVHKPAPAACPSPALSGDDKNGHDTRFITSIKQKVEEVQRIEEAL